MWFVEQVFKWFALVSSEYIGTAINNFKSSSHDEAVALEFMAIFFSLSIKATHSDRDCIKRVQIGVLILTLTPPFLNLSSSTCTSSFYSSAGLLKMHWRIFFFFLQEYHAAEALGGYAEAFSLLDGSFLEDHANALHDMKMQSLV